MGGMSDRRRSMKKTGPLPVVKQAGRNSLAPGMDISPSASQAWSGVGGELAIRLEVEGWQPRRSTAATCAPPRRNRRKPQCAAPKTLDRAPRDSRRRQQRQPEAERRWLLIAPARPQPGHLGCRIHCRQRSRRTRISEDSMPRGWQRRAAACTEACRATADGGCGDRPASCAQRCRTPATRRISAMSGKSITFTDLRSPCALNRNGWPARG